MSDGLFAGSIERLKWRIAIGGVVLLLFSGYSAFMQARYALFGTAGTATVTNATVYSRGQSTEVQYQFTDDAGNSRKGYGSLPGDQRAEYTPGTPIDIEYLAGVGGDVRVEGTGSWVMAIPAGVALVALGVVSFRFWRGYVEHQRWEARNR